MTKNYISKALQFIGVAKTVRRKYIETQTKASFGRPLNISGVRFDFELSVGSIVPMSLYTAQDMQREPQGCSESLTFRERLVTWEYCLSSPRSQTVT